MKFKKTTLPNGLTIITAPMKDNPTATVLVMVEAGSKYENKKISGLSHFLEHMCFKGTEKRPTALHISHELDGIGAQYNAFTSEEFTGYYAKAASKHLPKILDVVSDIYLHQTFPETEMEKEKGVIVEEINMYHDMPQRHVQELIMKVLYGNQPAGWSIAGSKESVRAMNRQQFVDYRSAHYVAKATTIIVAGHFNEAQVIKDVKQTFAKISKGKKTGKQRVKEQQSAPKFEVERRKLDQSHIVLGVRAFKVGDKREAAARVLNGVLGAGMSSRLFQKLREEMGVGYYVRSSYDAFTDHGILSVSIGADVTRVAEVVSAILFELKRFLVEKVSPEELEKTKEYLMGSLLLGLESSDEIAEFYGHQQVMRAGLKTTEEMIAEIKKVTPEQIQAVAKDMFKDANLNLAAVGPMPEDPTLKKLLKF